MIHKYNDVDIELHLLAQILAKVNRTFVQKEKDDSHVNLAYEPGFINARWISTDSGEKFLLRINLSENRFEWVAENRTLLYAVSFLNTCSASIEEKLAVYLDTLGFNPSGYNKELHFEIPDYPSRNKRFEALDPEGLSIWKDFREIANKTSENILTHLGNSGEPRIWPHHFDTGIYSEVTEKIGIGFGLAMQDEMAGAPYFYLAGYALGESPIHYIDMPFSTYGKWQTEGKWKGFIMPLNKLQAWSHDEKIEQIDHDMKKATDWFLR